jgi:hypothetical protein
VRREKRKLVHTKLSETFDRLFLFLVMVRRRRDLAAAARDGADADGVDEAHVDEGVRTPI